MVNLRLILAFLAPTLLILFLIQRHGATLMNEKAPYGIVSLELAGKATEAQSIVDSWKKEGKTTTALGNIRLDFLFIPFYSILLYMACGTLATFKPSRPQRVGAWIAFGSLLAGLFDVLENVAMTAILRGMSGTGLAPVTSALATAKHALLGAALAYILFSTFRLLMNGRGTPPAYTH
jgi:hypothetical protein